jgi:hypothetical protein
MNENPASIRSCLGKKIIYCEKDEINNENNYNNFIGQKTFDY